MTVSLSFFSDAGLTTPLSSINAVQASDNSVGAVDRVIYLGSNAVGMKFNASSDPGVDQISISIASSGAGPAVSTISLASTSGGLNTATPGNPLDVGTQLLSGAGNSVAVYVRVDLPATTAGRYTNLSLETNDLVEVDA